MSEVVLATVNTPTAPAHDALSDIRDAAREEVARVVVGHEVAVDLLLVAAVAGGHVLLEGPPGTAKTLLSAAVARALGVHHKRVQFTPETTPQELIGETIKRVGEDVFIPGALFTNVLLADEINRTPPRTQAALLEAMQERHVSYRGKTTWLPKPFMVIATQNPHEHEGIFPLPESQLDRFLFKVDISYGSVEDDIRMLQLPHAGVTPDLLGEVRPLLDAVRLERAQVELDATELPHATTRFLVTLIRATRDVPGVVLGAGPRAAFHLAAAARANARLDGRSCVSNQDIVAMAPYVLTHRLVVDDADPAEVVVAATRAAESTAVS
jgi:MoxR-like ATPase